MTMASDGETSCTNDPNFAVIYSFLKVFGNQYGLEVPTIVKLQEIIEDTQEVSEPLKELHLRLLRRALKSVQSNRWERCLIKFCHQHGFHQEAWELERFTYKKASTQVKLKILKLLLEYQFTCHPKFKSAVNLISSKELRLDPIGRDKSGCVYWLQVDHEANLCLYREDQDEETWRLIARNREELVRVIALLKSGEDVCPINDYDGNEDSNAVDETPLEGESIKEPENNEEEEFLSPESESEQESDETPIKKVDTAVENNDIKKEETKVDMCDVDNEILQDKCELSKSVTPKVLSQENETLQEADDIECSQTEELSQNQQLNKTDSLDNTNKSAESVNIAQSPENEQHNKEEKVTEEVVSPQIEAHNEQLFKTNELPVEEKIDKKELLKEQLSEKDEQSLPLETNSTPLKRTSPIRDSSPNRESPPKRESPCKLESSLKNKTQAKDLSPKTESPQKSQSFEKSELSQSEKLTDKEETPQQEELSTSTLKPMSPVTSNVPKEQVELEQIEEIKPVVSESTKDSLELPDTKLDAENSSDSKDKQYSCDNETSNVTSGCASPSILDTEEKESNSEKIIESNADDVGEAIEEPVMVVTGEGNGADCESSYIIGEEISEPVMFFYGEGWGYDNDTGNPEVLTQEHSASEHSDANESEEKVNGEHSPEKSDEGSKNNVGKGIRLRSSVTPVAKRSLKKQSNDTESLKPSSKKPCVRDKSANSKSSNNSGPNSNNANSSSVNEKSSLEVENNAKSDGNKKKGKSKTKVVPVRKMKIKAVKEPLNSTVTDNGHDSKTSIIEKRKSSVSSVDQDQEADKSESEKEKSPEKEVKAEDDLPPKKIRLETTPESDIAVSHSKETVDNVNKSDKDNLSEDNEDSISKRKKIKANKGKLSKRNFLQNKTDSNKLDKGDSSKNSSVLNSKSLKRSIMDATMSDKNKSESQSESDDDEPITVGKRLKMKPKKIATLSRKKIEAKRKVKNSSDESEEETLYSLANKKSSKKVLKKKPKEKSKPSAESDSDLAPVRQSRRIAQLKIREEAERRHMEEVALRELKMIHKKKTTKDEEEDWVQSDRSRDSSEGEAKFRKPTGKWKANDSTGPDPDSESDEPLFEHDEPDLVFNNKSDHEFSPESDLEDGEPVEPTKRVRTLQEIDIEEVCKRCGSGEQPEWILLCDRCDAGYHASCLKPVLFLVPHGAWHCPPCDHEMLIESLEKELVKYDELLSVVEEERARKKLEEPEKQSEEEDGKDDKSKNGDDDDSDSSSGSCSSSSSGAVYRLRARRALPVSYRSQEYDRLISSAIKEEYVEPTTSAGNQGRGKDISTIIEAAEEEKMKKEREAIEQGLPVEVKKSKKKNRRKPRKLNSLDVPSEDDDETDEDFRDTGLVSSSEEISSSAERDSLGQSGSSSSTPLRRPQRDRGDRPKLRESSPETKKKKKGVFDETTSESDGKKEWSEGKKEKRRSRPNKPKRRRDKSHRKSHKSHRSDALKQYDAMGNVIRSRVTYGGLSDQGENDWSPKHRTRQKKINYTEMPNTESEDEMHKSSGKHMPDSSDEFKIDDSDISSDSDGDKSKKKKEEENEEEKRKAISDLIKKTAVVPLEKLPEDVTKAKTEELEAHLCNLSETTTPRGRGRGSRGGRGQRSGRGGRGAARRALSDPTDPLSNLVGLKIKDLRPDGVDAQLTPLQMEREKKRQEREAKLAEKEAKRQERMQKKEEKEKQKEMKAKEREEKRLARVALQESKRLKKEKPDSSMSGGVYVPIQDARVYGGPQGPHGGPPGPHGGPMGPHGQPGFPQVPRLQVRAELRGVLTAEDRLRPEHPPNMREGTLSVAGSPTPYKPVCEEPSVITRMPHAQQYSQMMYGPGGARFPPRALYAPAPPPRYPPHYFPRYPPSFPQRHQLPIHSQSPLSMPMRPGHSQAPSPHSQSHPLHSQSSPLSLPIRPSGHSQSPSPHSHRPQLPQSPSLMRPDSPHSLHRPGNQASPLMAQLHRQPGPHPGGLHQGPHPEPHSQGPHPPGPHQGPHPQGPPGPHLQSTHPPGPHHQGPPHLGSHPSPSNHPTPNHSSGPHPPPSNHPPGPHIQGPRPPGPHHQGAHPPPSNHPPGPYLPPTSHPGPHGHPLGPPAVHTGPRPHAVSPPTQPREEPIRIKTEVKTEPESRSPPPSPPSSEIPRPHPKMKRTEHKERVRHPLGPYAPQYGPYGPYAPEQGLTRPHYPEPRPPNPRSPAPRPLYHPEIQSEVRSPATRLPYPPPLVGDQRPPILCDQRPSVLGDQRPPLHDQRPPILGDQRPPILGEQRPPLHEQRPPLLGDQRPPILGDQRPPLHEQRPPLHDQRSPILGDQRPPLHDQRPPLHDQRPSLHDQRPPLHDQRPPLHDQHPPLHDQRPPLHDQRPPILGDQRPPPLLGDRIPAARSPAPRQLQYDAAGPYIPPHLRGYLPSYPPQYNIRPEKPPDEPRPLQFSRIDHETPPQPPPLIKEETPEGGSVFGGLVSYFSSQRDDLDA